MEDQTYIDYLNHSKIKGHEVVSLRYNSQGNWAFVVLCSCGALHRIGGFDDHFVIWDTVVTEEKSWKTFSKDDLPKLKW